MNDVADALILNRLFRHLFNNGVVSSLSSFSNLVIGTYIQQDSCMLLTENHINLFLWVSGEYRFLSPPPIVLPITCMNVDCRGICFYPSLLL